MQKISVVVIVYNEERNIKDCLESIKWVDEIILVDAFSEDKTIEIAKEYTDKIFQRQWQGYSQQKNFGLFQASNEWIIFVDSDERISEELAEEIRVALERNNGLYDGYYIPRQSFYLGRRIKHGEWYPDLKLRLINKHKGSWSGPSVHEKLTLNGKVGYLKNPILHYTYRDISYHLEKFNRYSSLFAQDAFNKGEKVNLYKLLWRPIIRFFRGYFIKKGFLDGFAGFVIAFMQSLEIFLRYAKLRELKRSRDNINVSD